MSLRRRLAILALGFGLSACESDSLAPVTEAAGAPAGLSLTAGEMQGARYVPILERLMDQAIAEIRRGRGEEAAVRLSADYARLRDAARDAHAAGQIEVARTLEHESHAEAARVVARVFPSAARRIAAAVHQDLSKLNPRIAKAEAAGTEVTRVKAIAQRATRLQQAAIQDLMSGRFVAALLHGSEALDLLASLKQRQ